MGKKVRWLVEKYLALCKMEWAVMMAYRSETVIWMAGAFVQPLVSLAVWLSISGQGTINGYGAKDYIVYFLGVIVTERLTRSWDIWELDRDIREGELSAKLIRPMHPVHWSIAQNLVYKMFFALLLIPSWVVLAAWNPVFRPPVDGWTFLMAFLALFLSSIIRFLIGYEFGLLAFWTNRAVAIYMLFEGLHLFFSGRIAPLSMFPEWMAVIAHLFPFYATVGFPVDLLTGKLSDQWEAVVWGFSSQIIWTLLLAFLFRWEWRQGLRKNAAVGG